MRRGVIAAFVASCAVAAAVAAFVIMVLTWIGELMRIRPGASDLCLSTMPESAVVSEGDPPRFEFSWFPYGHRCAWSDVTGGTLSGDLRWEPTIAMACAAGLLLVAVVLLVLTRRAYAPMCR